VVQLAARPAATRARLVARLAVQLVARPAVQLVARPAVRLVARLAGTPARLAARPVVQLVARPVVQLVVRPAARLERSASAASAALAASRATSRPTNARFGSPGAGVSIFSPRSLFFTRHGAGDDRDREDAVLEVRVDRLLGEIEDVLHLIAAA